MPKLIIISPQLFEGNSPLSSRLYCCLKFAAALHLNLFFPLITFINSLLYIFNVVQVH